MTESGLENVPFPFYFQLVTGFRMETSCLMLLNSVWIIYGSVLSTMVVSVYVLSALFLIVLAITEGAVSVGGGAAYSGPVFPEHRIGVADGVRGGR